MEAPSSKTNAKAPYIAPRLTRRIYFNRQPILATRSDSSQVYRQYASIRPASSRQQALLFNRS